MPQVYGIDPHHKEPQHQYGIELYDKHRQKSIYQSVENITSKYTLCLFINPGQPKTQYDCKDKKIREDPYFVEMCPSQTKGEYAKFPTPHHTTPVIMVAIGNVYFSTKIGCIVPRHPNSSAPPYIKTAWGKR